MKFIINGDVVLSRAPEGYSRLVLFRLPNQFLKQLSAALHRPLTVADASGRFGRQGRRLFPCTDPAVRN